MNNWLKILIAAACLVICAAGGNVVWERWQSRNKSAADRVAAFEFFNAKQGDVEAATKACDKVRWNLNHAADLNWNDHIVAYTERIIALCDANDFN